MGYYDDCLEHHGIKGMHWGVRRYQNKDGSLTTEGKKRVDIYNKSKELQSKHFNSANALRKQFSKVIDGNKQLKKEFVNWTYVDDEDLLYLRANEVYDKGSKVLKEFNKAYDKYKSDFKDYGKYKSENKKDINEGEKISRKLLSNKTLMSTKVSDVSVKPQSEKQVLKDLHKSSNEFSEEELELLRELDMY